MKVFRSMACNSEPSKHYPEIPQNSTSPFGFLMVRHMVSSCYIPTGMVHPMKSLANCFSYWGSCLVPESASYHPVCEGELTTLCCWWQ